MPPNRATLALSITVVGPLLTSLAWLWIGASDAGPSELVSLQAQFNPAEEQTRHRVAARSSFASQLMIRPLFQSASASGGAPVEPSLRLEGLAKTSRRTAALIAIGDQAPQWLEVGQTQSGVTLQAITSDGVTVVTINGARPLKLGRVSAQFAANPAPPHPASSPPSR